MTRKRMFAEMAIGLGILSVLAVFGRGQLSRFQGEGIKTPRQTESAAERGTPAASELVETPPVTAPDAEETAAAESAAVGEQQETPRGGAGEPQPSPAAEQAALPPDPQAVRDSAAAELAALGPLHDELIEILEAIQEAQTDRWERRWARDKVTMARFSKGHDVRRFEPDVTAEPEWRVRSGRRRVALAKEGLERKIEEARATLAQLRGTTPSPLEEQGAEP